MKEPFDYAQDSLHGENSSEHVMGLVFATKLKVKNGAEEEHDEGAEEDDEGGAGGGIMVDFGDEVGGGDVDGDAGGKGEGVGDGPAKDQHHGRAGEGRGGEQSAGGKGGAASAAAGQHDGGDGKALGQLVKEDGEKDQHAEAGGNKHSRSDGHAVKKRVDGQAHQDRPTGVSVGDFGGVSFLAKMKMRGNGVFEEMHQQIAAEDEKKNGRARRGQANGFGNHLQERGGQHETRAESYEIFQELAGPLAP